MQVYGLVREQTQTRVDHCNNRVGIVSNRTYPAPHHPDPTAQRWWAVHDYRAPRGGCGPHVHKSSRESQIDANARQLDERRDV